MSISENWQKTAPTSTLGTPALAFFAINIDGDLENDFELSDSLFAKAIRGVQAVADIYLVGRPNGSWVTVATTANTTPFGVGEEVGDGGRNSKLEAVISEATGQEVTVWNAYLDGNDLNFD